MSDLPIEAQILPLENDEIIHESQLPRITRATARMTYNFLMAGMVARLHLFLFGEMEKETIDILAKSICERRTVFDQIIDNRVPPLRAVYDFLVKENLIEAQDLPEVALSFIDQPDTLQNRILSIDEEQKHSDCDAAWRMIVTNSTFYINPYQSYATPLESKKLKDMTLKSLRTV